MPWNEAIPSVGPVHAEDMHVDSPRASRDAAPDEGMDVVLMQNSAFDHIAVRWGSSVPQGFNPDDWLHGTARMSNEHGAVNGIKHYATSRAQNEAGRAYTHRYLQDHPKYRLFGDNCVNYVEGVLRAEGIRDAPSASEHLTPINYFNALPAPTQATPIPGLLPSLKNLVGK